MNKDRKYFIVVQREVKYPTWCKHGLILKEVKGTREYHVDKFLGDKLINKVGQTVEENFDFEVIHRKIENAFLCDKGEIAGGGMKKNGLHLSMIGDGNGKQKEYLAKNLIPIQFAETVKSSEYLENIKWRKIEEDFSNTLKKEKLTTIQIVSWFREKIKNEIN